MFDLSQVPDEYKSLFEQMAKATENTENESFPGSTDICMKAALNSLSFIKADKIMERIESNDMKELLHIIISILWKHNARLNSLEIINKKDGAL